MTPQERQLVSELFDRLTALENRPRDPEAEAMVIDGLRRAPNAVYALVQTALVQDEALRQADARIRELESGAGEPAPAQGGFLDNMRDTLFGGRRDDARGSVPSVGGGQPQYAPSPFGRQDAQPQAAPGAAPGQQGGGSFLGTAAASAAGVIGGALLLNSFRSMFPGSGSSGGGEAKASSAMDPSAAGSSPWGGGQGGSNDLSRDAGVGDIGRSAQDSGQDRSGWFDTASNDQGEGDEDGDDSDFDFGGDSDFG